MRGPTILQAFEQRALETPDGVALLAYGDPAQTRTWSQWHRDARAFAATLIETGCTPGEAVAILAGNTAVWPIADLGTLMAGCVSVGVYPTSAPVQVHEILNDCGARVVVVDTEDQLAKVMQVRAALPNLRAIIYSAPGWLDEGRAALGRQRDEIDGRIADASLDDVAILIYTSGSTGVPKGARITHRYITASAESICTALGLTAADTSLSFLPYCHAGERIFGLYTRIAVGMSALLIERTSEIWDAARGFEPTLFGGLPRFYEKIYEALVTRHAAQNGDGREEWDRALRLGRERTRVLAAGGRVAADLEAAWAEAAVPLRETIAELIGGRIRLATSGGAMLPGHVAEYLAAAGLIVVGAYGLTEHLCGTMHRPDSFSFDSAGAPMPGTQLRISESGEILIRRSALTFSGYQNNPAETRAAFTADGEWLRTGDLGHLDEHGRLHVTGREKELIALSGGKKVAPVPIERRLSESPWISQAVLFGENRKYISALITLRREYAEQWASRQGLVLSFDALVAHPEVFAHVQAEVDAVNRTLSRPEQIKRFALLPAELSAEAEELTPTMKIRRSVIEQKYQLELAALYPVPA